MNLIAVWIFPLNEGGEHFEDRLLRHPPHYLRNYSATGAGCVFNQHPVLTHTLINNPPLDPLTDVPRSPDFRHPLQDYVLEDHELFDVLSSSLHALQLFHQRIDKDTANSPRQDVVALGWECDNLPPVGLPQLVVGDATVKMCSIVMMEHSTA